MSRFFMLVAAVAGAVAVTLGAIGAHELKDLLAADRFDVFLTGVRYLAIHAVILFVTGWFMLDRPGRWLAVAGFLFMAGMLLFSGSLVLLAVTPYRFLGAVAPVGGLSYVAGWLLLGLGAWKAAH